MPVLLTRDDLRPLFEEPKWIEESLGLFADTLRGKRYGSMSWLLFPAATPGTSLNVQLESAVGAGTYLRVYPDRLAASRSAAGQPGLLLDSDTGSLLALMALDDLNNWRTAGPVGVAARVLTPRNARTLGLVGSGAQARYQLRAIRHAVPSLSTVRVFSRTPEHRERFAGEMSAALGTEVVAVDTPAAAVTGADIVLHHRAGNLSRDVLGTAGCAGDHRAATGNPSRAGCAAGGARHSRA